FPLSIAEPGKLGLAWPEGVSLQSLHALQLPSPAVPSMLDAADSAYLRGDYSQAQRLYQQVLLRSKDARIRQEARFKEGMCLLALKRDPDARTVFEALAAEANPDLVAAAREDWLLHAECQLIQLYQRENSPESLARVGALLDKLAALQ